MGEWPPPEPGRSSPPPTPSQPPPGSPYPPPVPPSAQPSPYGPPAYAVPGEPPRYRPLRRRMRLVAGLLLAGIVADAVGLWSGIEELVLLGDIDAGVAVSDEALEANDRRQAIVAGLQVAVFTLTVAAFLAWLYRAYANLEALGAQLRFGRGWAVGGWFVPVLNLWRPKQIVNDVWRASDPAAPAEQRDWWRVAHAPGFLLAWWLAYLAASWLYTIGARLTGRGTDLETTRAGSATLVAGDVVSIVAAVLALLVVVRLTRREEARAAALGLVPEEIPTPVYRRWPAWGTAGAVVVALALQGLVLWALYSGALAPGPGGELEAGPAGPADPDVIIADSFEDPATGWLVEEDDEYAFGYAAGAYRIDVRHSRGELYEQHSYRLFTREYDGLEIFVTGRLHRGDDGDGWGVGCWVGEDAGYFGSIYADDVYVLARDAPGPEGLELMESDTAGSGALRGKFTANELELRCVPEGDTVRVTLRVNGGELATVNDPEPLGPFDGIGLFASSLGDTVAVFDDLEVREVAGAG